MVDSFLTVLAGGGTGLIGSLIGRVAGYFEERQKLKRVEMELSHEIKLQEMQMADRAAERESEQAIVADQVSGQMLVGSYEHDTGYNDSALRWIRPLLTLLLVIGAFWVYHSAPNELTKSDLAAQLVYFASVAVSWWFADRSGRVKL